MEESSGFLLTKKGQLTERLLDLGNPAAAAWLLDKVDSQLVAQGIDVYRQDFNFEPLEFWRQHDAPIGRALPRCGTSRGICISGTSC